MTSLKRSDGGIRSWFGRRKLPLRRLLERTIVDAKTGCWLFQGCQNPGGYTVCYINGSHVGAHTLSYRLLVGGFSNDLDLDHLCRVRNCINPSHLEPVTRKENMFRAIKKRLYCGSGHKLNTENLNAHKRCKTCDRNKKAVLRKDPQYREKQKLYMKEYSRKYYHAKKLTNQRVG